MNKISFFFAVILSLFCTGVLPRISEASPIYLVTGHVQSSLGQAIANQAVQLQHEDGTKIGDPIYTGTDGAFLYDGLTAGTYVVRPVQGPGQQFNPATRTVVVPGTVNSARAEAPLEFTRSLDPAHAENLVFSSTREGNDEIYLLRADASEPVRISPLTSRNRSPNLNRRGTRLAFDTDRDGNSEIYSMNLDGGDVRRLTVNHAGDEYPSYSPDGYTLVWSSSLGTPDTEMWTMNVDGANQTRVTHSPYGDYHPSIGPGSTRYSYYTSLQGNFDQDIFTINPDGTDRVELTTTHADQDPSYSPDGKSILFTSWRDGNNEIYVMGVDGKNVRRLTHNPADDGRACWSTSGKYVYFRSNRNGSYHIFRARADGTGDVVAVTFGPGDDTWPTAGPFQPPTPGYSVSGTIRNGKGTPLAGVTVNLFTGTEKLAGQRITDMSGNYGFTDLPPEQFVVRPEAGPYQTFSPSQSTVEFPTTGGPVSPNARRNFTRTVDLSSAHNVAFYSNRSGNLDVYLLPPGATEAIQLTNDPLDEFSPNISPRGNKILYVSNKAGNNQLFSMNTDGSDKKFLIDGQDPAWSYDGRFIVYSSAHDASDAELWIMKADGSGQKRLTHSPFGDYRGSLSPNGNRLVYYGFLTAAGNPDIFTVKADGTDVRQLTTTHADHNPYWSPDGTKIVFSSARDGHAEIYMMNPDGTDQTRLTFLEAQSDQPSWSPDGKYIFFFSDFQGNKDLYRMSADGTDILRLQEHPSDDFWPSAGPAVVTRFEISGTIVNGKGTPLQGLLVNLFDSEGMVLTHSTTGSVGKYLFGNLPAGTYRVRPESVTGFNFTPSEVEITLPTSGPSAPDATANFTRTAVPATASPSGHSG